MNKIYEILILGVILSFLIIIPNVEGKVQISPIIDKDSLIESPGTVSMIIGFKDKVGKDELTLLRSHGAKIKRVLKEINAVSVRIPNRTVSSIRNNPKIKYITENNKGIHNATENIPWGVDKIDAELVHSQYKGAGIIVAVTDTGIDYNHEDLVGKVIGGWDYVNNDPDPMDDFGHGTHVAGTIAANDNDIGVIGVAPDASLLNMKMCDSGGWCTWDDAAASVIDSANSGAKIISMSWGGCVDDPTLRSAIQYASAQGVLLVAAAGNSWGGSICWPAAYHEVMAITATDQNDNIAYFSSIGPEAEASAPGVSVLSTVPTGYCELCDPSGYALLSGTSMAAPHVSGTAALIWSAYPGLTRDQVRRRITDYAIDLGTAGRDSSYGFGRINAFASVTQNPPLPQKPFYMMIQPTYNWIDGVTGGTPGPIGDDGVSDVINIGFNFPFYGVQVSQLKFSTNGLIGFDTTDSLYYYINSPIPNINSPNKFAAPYWNDLYVDGSIGRTYYKLDMASTPKRFIITWQDVRLLGGTARTSFEAILYEDGRILYQYQQPSLFETDGETIGIEDVGGTRGQQYKYNEPVNDYSTVLFMPLAGIIVTSPNGGEIWTRGTTNTISWNYAGNPGPYVKIELIKGGTLDSIISSSYPIGYSGSGYYNWYVPSTQVIGTDYKIRVTGTNNPGLTDVSNNNFAIIRPASITVTSPNGGENWAIGTTKTITWTYTGDPGANVKIELLKGGTLYRTITGGTPNDGTYESFYIDPTIALGNDYKVRITSTSNSIYTDNSDNNFIISSSPTITIVSPNGGETWQRGTTHTISWANSGNPGTYVKIELLKAGIVVNTITSSTLNDGSHSWTIPWLTLGSDYKIKITSTSNSAYTDISNNNFIIGGINIISPNGGESWLHGTTHTITWSSAGSPGAYVKIDLYKAGIFKQTISSSTPNDGSHSWYIPTTQTLGTDYKIKITSISNYAYYDWSNNYFRIY